MQKIIIIVTMLLLSGCGVVYSKQELLKKGDSGYICTNMSIEQAYNILLQKLQKKYPPFKSGIAYGGSGPYAYTSRYFVQGNKLKKTILIGIPKEKASQVHRSANKAIFGSETYNIDQETNKYFIFIRFIKEKKYCKTKIVITSMWSVSDAKATYKDWLK